MSLMDASSVSGSLPNRVFFPKEDLQHSGPMHLLLPNASLPNGVGHQDVVVKKVHEAAKNKRKKLAANAKRRKFGSRKTRNLRAKKKTNAVPRANPPVRRNHRDLLRQLLHDQNKNPNGRYPFRRNNRKGTGSADKRANSST